MYNPITSQLLDKKVNDRFPASNMTAIRIGRPKANRNATISSKKRIPKAAATSPTESTVVRLMRHRDTHTMTNPPMAKLKFSAIPVDST